MDTKDKDQKQGKEVEVATPAKPPKPLPKQQRWGGLGGNSGIKNAKAVHSRMPTGRGSARGR